jgi:hypothetical protein
LYNLKFDRPDVLIENTSSYYHWYDGQPNRRDLQLAYAETILASDFVLCPRGAGSGTMRFFEVMAAGVAPVLISDDYELPPGPDWDKFLIRVRERDIAGLPELLQSRVGRAAEYGRQAREAYVEYFSIEREFDVVVELAERSLRHGLPSEEQFQMRQAAIIRGAKQRRAFRNTLRTLILKTLRVLRLKNPYQMNR